MGLNNIELPASAIAELYKNSLVECDPVAAVNEPVVVKPGTAVETVNEARWKYLGENKKNILVVVNYPDAVYLPDDELNFLIKMLTACKLSLADVAVFNKNNHKNAGYKELSSDFKSKIIFLFGIDPVSFGLPLSFPHFQVQSFANTTFLFTPPLEDRKKDELLKSKLWVCLQKIFGL